MLSLDAVIGSCHWILPLDLVIGPSTGGLLRHKIKAACAAADVSGCCFADGHPGAIIAASGKLKDRHLLTHEDEFQQVITVQLQR